MALQYKNRRGEIYSIQANQRGGKTAYSATRKPTGKLSETLPEGYEIYERPENAQVFVRKIRATHILPTERSLVETAIRKLAKLDHFILDGKVDSIDIYLTDAELDVSLTLMRGIAPMSPDQEQSMKDFMMGRARYEKIMRFVLSDKANRLFSAQRWCFRGGIDEWHFLAEARSLPELLERYVPHLGKESFFDLI